MLDRSFTNQAPNREAGSLGDDVASTCGDPKKTRFFFLVTPPAVEADLAAQQRKRRSSGREYRAMAPVVARGLGWPDGSDKTQGEGKGESCMG